MTQVQQQQQKATSLKQQVMRLLAWDELQYENYRFETGIAYLEYYIPMDKQGQGWLQRNRIFWDWWRNHWAIRDTEFTQAVMACNPTILQDIYGEYHDARTLANEVYPPGKLLGTTYSAMIQNVIDNTHKTKSSCI